MKVADHILIKFTTNEVEKLSNDSLIAEYIKRLSEALKSTIVLSNMHKFEVTGLTSFAVLKESHISVHTWPEHKIAVVDILTSGNVEFPKDKLTSLTNEFFNVTDFSIKEEAV